MRILLIGSGGREHALAWKMRQSPELAELFIAPGNGGTARLGVNVPIPAGDIAALLTFSQENKIDFIVPGPELPLVNGIADACQRAHIPCFGPSAYAAQLEGSKIFAKELMREAGVPTASYVLMDNYQQAARYIDSHGGPLVVKADGLAAGKGVVVAHDAQEAKDAARMMLHEGRFGQAGARILLEETLEGEEVSFLCLCDGETALPFPASQDHKAAFDHDLGPNTGGMGAYSPAPVLPDKDFEAIRQLAITPVLQTLKKRGHPFCGILYAGLMMSATGPKVLEYNVRFGDPECQPLLMRLQGDLVPLMLAASQSKLQGHRLNIADQAALCVVIAAEGYPDDYPVGMPIQGLDKAEQLFPGALKVFQAGTKLEQDRLVACGGRILGVTALGQNLAEAQKRAYAAAELITIDHSRFRRDIGAKGFKE